MNSEEIIYCLNKGLFAGVFETLSPVDKINSMADQISALLKYSDMAPSFPELGFPTPSGLPFDMKVLKACDDLVNEIKTIAQGEGLVLKKDSEAQMLINTVEALWRDHRRLTLREVG